MIHIVGNTGQLANQLFRFAHHLANAIEYNYTIKHHAFDYIEYFPNLANSRLTVLNKWPKTINRFLKKSIPYIDKMFILRPSLSLAKISLICSPFEFTSNDVSFLKSANNYHIIATDWHFRDYTNFNKHADTLRKLFEPPKSIIDKAIKYINMLKSEHDIVVGIHIRRGDYEHWKNGRFYYNDEVYIKFMQYIINLNPTKRVAFIICSNEKIAKKSFTGFNIFISQNTFIEDLTILSKCEIIIGPPSSFSGWASFMGNTPLHYILDSSKPLLAEDFSVIMG